MAIRVVLVDDHATMRAAMRDLLEMAAGIEVIGEAGDGREGLALAGRLAPDVLVLDVELPGLDGAGVAEQLRREGSPVRILAMSSRQDAETIRAMLESGAAGYLAKTDAFDWLVEGIRRVAQGEKNWLSPGAARLR